MSVISLNAAKRGPLSKFDGSGSSGVSNWRSETASDLEDARTLIEAAMESISGEPTREQLRSVWKAYVDIEKSILFIRVEFDEENPGRFLSLKGYSTPDERQALGFALKNLKKGSESFRLGEFTQALKELRDARNFLRALLRAKQMQKVRKARARPG